MFSLLRTIECYAIIINDVFFLYFFMHTFGRILASLSGLFVTVFGAWGVWQFVAKVKEAMDLNPQITFMDILSQGGGIEMALVLSLLLLGLNLFIPNCVLFRMLCKKSCAGDTGCKKSEADVEVVKA